jgi:CheY-like chemotaxis protein
MAGRSRPWHGQRLGVVMDARTILVADDDALLRESLCDLLADLGYAPRPAADGRGAIRILDHEACQLVLSDIDMPDMTGFALLGWIREHGGTPAVLMSARADQHLATEAQRCGALALWAKPVGSATVTTFISSFFSSSAS